MILFPIVFLINGLTKGAWGEAFFFAIAVAVGLTPEMLPMIVTSNLAKGALSLSKHKVIVKELAAIKIWVVWMCSVQIRLERLPKIV